MEEKRIDIDEFEYEMTEVILMLKGEFAAVSGKKLGLSQYFANTEKQNPPKEVIAQLQKPAVVELQPMQIPAVLAGEIENPAGMIRDKAAAEETIFQFEAMKLDGLLPSPKPMECPDILPVLLEDEIHMVSVPTVSRVAIPESVAVEYSSQRVALPQMDQMPRISIQTVQAVQESVEVPQVLRFAIQVPEPEIQPVAVDMPQVKPFAQVGKDAKDIRISAKPQETTALPSCCVPAISIQPLSAAEVCVDVPSVQQISVTVFKPEVAPVTVDIPDVKPFMQMGQAVLRGAATVDILKSTLDIEVPEVAIPSIPPVSVSAMTVRVPQVRKDFGRKR